MDRDAFLKWFRSTSPYVHAHRGSTVVLAFGGEVVASAQLTQLVQDVAMLHSLGVRLVLVAGARPQVDERLARRGHQTTSRNGLRVTDAVALACLKEAVGAVRVELEAHLSMGLPSSPMAGARLRVVTGNFVMAKPRGVVDGVDYQSTGEVRRIDAAAIRQQLDSHCIVLLSPIGYSITGEVFNLKSEEVAAQCAGAIQADKLILLTDAPGLNDDRGRLRGEITLSRARQLLERGAVDNKLKGALRAAIDACTRGVPRAHLLGQQSDGAILLELFTRDGAGTLVTKEPFEDVRAASLQDVPAIEELIRPLEAQGLLLGRSRERIESEIEKFVVIERDGAVIGCAALYGYPDEQMAEIACLAVHPDYAGAGRGGRLVRYLEKSAQERGLTSTFALSTRALHWFRERGYQPAQLETLPAARRASLDGCRNAQVFVKSLA